MRFTVNNSGSKPIFQNAFLMIPNFFGYVLSDLNRWASIFFFNLTKKALTNSERWVSVAISLCVGVSVCM